jgi:hypothetical protein
MSGISAQKYHRNRIFFCIMVKNETSWTPNVDHVIPQWIPKELQGDISAQNDDCDRWLVSEFSFLIYFSDDGSYLF